MKLHNYTAVLLCMHALQCSGMKNVGKEQRTIADFLNINAEELSQAEYEKYENDFINLLSSNKNNQLPHATKQPATSSTNKEKKKTTHASPASLHSIKASNTTKKAPTTTQQNLSTNQQQAKKTSKRQRKKKVAPKQPIATRPLVTTPSTSPVIAPKNPEKEYNTIAWNGTRALMRPSQFNVKSLGALIQKMEKECDDCETNTIEGTVYVNNEPIDWVYSQSAKAIDFYPEGFPSSFSSEESK